ncbi:hypothetical protein RhiJN_00341 [Ceratobasidium sp. AG-Ba]|nr:hypothetical protein RhiJN_00341 [Ceratobasidium sp. AG-Ba]
MIGEVVRVGTYAGGERVRVSRARLGGDCLTVAVDRVGIRLVQVPGKEGDESSVFGDGFKFLTSAVTVIHSDQIQRTYAATVRSKDEGKSKAGRVLSVWSWPVESSEDVSYSHIQMDTRISRVHTLSESDYVLVVLEDGTVSVVSSNLEVLGTIPPPRSLDGVFDSWVLRGFVSSTVVLVFGRVQDKAWVVAYGVKDGALHIVGEAELKDVDASLVTGASCSDEGYLSVLYSTGLCTTFTLSPNPFAATASPSPLHFQRLVPSSLAIHALTSSTLVLAGTTTASPPKLALLVWDTQYSTLLAERLAPLPSPSDPNLSISLSGSTRKNLTITTGSSVLTTPLTPPSSTSTIASALVAQSSTSSHWLVPPQIEDETKSTLVDRIRGEVQAGRAAQADAAFFRWVEATAEAEAEGTLVSATRAAAKIPFPSSFAAALVDAAFPLEDTKEKKGDEGPDFASGVVSALVWRGAAGQGMIRRPGGLYGELRKRRDWPIMLSALQHVPDIPEDEIVATIHDLIIPLHSTPSEPLTNAPSLQNGLAHLLAYPTSPAPLRLALRTHLRDAEDVVHVLKVLDSWLKRGVSFDVWELEGLQAVNNGGKGKSVGVSTGGGRKKVKGAGMIPALEHIVSFTQAILDTHLLTLLQHRPAHPLLRSISSSLAPLPAYNDALQTLAAPLAPFAAEDALERKTGSGHRNGAGGWLAKEEYRKQRRAQFAAEAIAIGEYRFEELIL